MTQVVVIHHDPKVIKELLGFLGKQGFGVATADAPRTGLGLAKADGVELVCVEFGAGGRVGKMVHAALQSRPNAPKVVWLGAEGDRPFGIGESWSAAAFLEAPYTAEKVAEELDGLLPESLEKNWSGLDALEKVNGSGIRFPPMRVLFLAHRVNGTGQFGVEQDGQVTSLNLYGGKVVGVLGVPNLMQNESGSTTGQNLEQALGASIAQGVSPEKAMDAAALGIGAWVASLDSAKLDRVWFDTHAQAPERPMVLTTTVARMLALGNENIRPFDIVRAELKAKRRLRVEVWYPDDSPETRWGLPSVALRLLRFAMKNQVSGLSRAAPDEVWLAVDLMERLGMMTFTDEIVERRKSKKSGDGSTSSKRTSRRSSDDSTGEDKAAKHRSKDKSRSRSGSKRRSSKADHSDGNSGSSKEDSRLNRLRKFMKNQHRMTPLEQLGIEKAKDISLEGVSEAFRRSSADFHPDRFASESRQVRKMAQEAFSALGDANDALQDKAVLTDLRLRKSAEEEGRVYVSDVERKKAKLEFTKGDVYFRQRNYEVAHERFNEAHQLDPTEWKPAFMAARSGWLGGVLGSKDAIAMLRAVEVKGGKDRAELLFVTGEILISDGAEKEAFKCFEQAVSINPEHVGARRRIRLREMRETSEKQSGSDKEKKKSRFWGNKD